MKNSPLRDTSYFLFVSGLAVIGVGASANAQEARSVNRDPQRFAADIRAFQEYDRKNSIPRDAVLFVGSSSIRLWPTAQSFPELTLINRGFGGAHVSDVLHFAEQVVFKYGPRTIVFYAGDNDLAEGKTAEQVVDEFKSFVQQVHERLPQARVYFLSIKPSVARWQLWPAMQRANLLIRELADADDKMDFVDMSPPLLGDNGQPRASLFVADGLHLNDEGYRAWTKILATALAQSANHQ
jgi:lysophospholipase L1-like esterase